MERHDTHEISYSSSEEHSYQLDKNLSTKNISTENKYYIKEEEKNDWTEIFINNFKEMKNLIGIQGDIYNLNDISQSREFKEKIKESNTNSIKSSKEILKEKIKEKSKKKDKLKSKINDKSKDKSKDKSIDKSIDKSKDKSKSKSKDKIKYLGRENEKNGKLISLKHIEKNKDKNKSNTINNSPKTRNKKEKEKEKGIKEEKEKDKIEKKEIKEKSEKKDNNKDTISILSNGIVVKKINQQKEEEDEDAILNQKKLKQKKEDIIKEYLLNYNKSSESNKNPIIIHKPRRSFITKVYIPKSKQRNKLKNKNFFQKKSHSNIHTSSLGNYNKLNLKTKQSATSTKEDLKKEKSKSKTILINRNQNNIDKLDEKFSSLSTITGKKFTINNNSNLFFSSNISNKNNTLKKRPKSSYNVIKKEIDFNLKSSKLENSFNNKSFNIQKTCQISSIINTNIKTHKNRINRKKIIYENKNFLNDLKDLRNAFELSDNNINIKNNINNNNLNININNNFSERMNKTNITHKTNKKNEVLSKHDSENNNNNKKDGFSIKPRKLNSAKVRGKSYEHFYPRDPTPLFVEFSNKENIINDIKMPNIDNNLCKKCGYKKHFGCEKNCPICIDMKEKNKLNEKKLSNLNYYFPFKDKNKISIQNSFRNNNSNNSHKIKQIINHDSFINFINIKMENLLPVDYYYNSYYYNSIHTNLHKKKKLKMNSAKPIGSDKNIIYHKYNALQNYFE